MPLGSMKGGAYIGIDIRTYFEGGDLQCLKVNESMCVKCSECRGII